MATSKGTWKALERKIARLFGVERNSKKGLGEDTADMVALVKFKRAAILSGEIKLRAKSPAILEEILEQASKNCGKNHIPVGFFKPKYAKVEDAIVAFRLKDFLRLLE